MTLEQRLPEKRQERRAPDWSKLDVFTITTKERHHDKVRKKHLPDEAALLGQYARFITQLLDRADVTITTSERNDFRHVLRYIEIYNDSLREELLHPADTASALQQIIPPPVTTYQLDFSERGDNAIHMQRLEQLEDALIHTDRPRIISLSDSHSTSAVLLDRLCESGVGMSGVGVLSFDHHTDLRPFVHGPRKESVMSYALQRVGVGAVGVIGCGDYSTRLQSEETNRRSGYVVVGGSELYTNGLPNVREYYHILKNIFSDWKQRGITSVYTTVDLDGLRLLEQGYSATDYNPLDHIRGLVEKTADETVRDYINTDVTRMSASVAQDLVRWLSFFLGTAKLREYNGVPASWVTRSMRLARDQFGLKLGVPLPNTERRIVGDIVEYTTPDYQKRTAKITQALLGAMVTESL